MVGVIRPLCDGRMPRRSRAPSPQQFLLLLPLMLALLSVASGQWTTHVRLSCLADSAAAPCCIGSSCDEGSRARVQLEAAMSALRESEARSAQLEHNLTVAADRCRAASVAARSSALAAGAARNACDTHALELRASADAADHFATSATHDLRRAADERAVLRRRADGVDELLRAHDTGLRAIDRTLTETRSVLNATSSNVATVQSETTRNLSSLSDFVTSELFSISKRTNVSSDHVVELFKIVTQQESKISSLNQTQRYCEASWSNQRTVLNAQLNSSEHQRVIDMDALRLSTLSKLASVESRLDSTGKQLNESVERLSIRQIILNDSLASLSAAVRHDIQRAAILTESTLLANERKRVADMDDLRRSSLSRFALIDDRLNGTWKQLNDSVERLSLIHDSLNNSLTSFDATVRGDLERVAVMAESTMLRVKSDLASNLSTLANTVASLNLSKQIDASRISELSIIADQLKFVLSYLNRTQQESDNSCKRRSVALSAELNVTKLSLEQLSVEFGRLRDENERLTADVRNLSAARRGCSSGWQRNGSWCYLLVTSLGGSWSQSRERCLMIAADLVTVPSAAVNAFLRAYMVNYSETGNVWLGATDVEREGVWRWITGEVFYNVSLQRSYVNFAAGEPANTYRRRQLPENCLVMNRLGSWNDTYCFENNPFFCQMYRP